MKYMTILTLLALLLAACATAQDADQLSIVAPETTAVESNQRSVCDLLPITIPTLPNVIPGYAQLDETTGLHVTGTPPGIDFSTYRLAVTGLVENPISLTYDEMRCFPKVTANPLLSCRGYFEDVANWSGVLLADILAEAGPLAEAKTVTLISADGYQAEIPLGVAMDQESFLAYELEGETLPILHGFPLRAVIPSREGLYWVKWLVELNVN
jgi:DMSO/TMAO reductase YedYZ molybdopterin-dependent catalytic subunit